MSDTNLGKTESCTNYNLIAEWKCWCRLCAKPNAQYINALTGQCVPSYCNVYNSINIVAVLAEFFQLHIKEDEKLSPLICTECYNVVKSYVDFSANIRKVQELYDDLLHSDNEMRIDFSALYEKHGLLSKETFASQISTELPVEEVFIADSHAASTSHTSKFPIKNEKLTEALSPEALIKEFEKEEEMQDPIAEEKLVSGMEGSIKTSKNNKCTDNDDFDMQTDSWMMLEEDNRLNNENIESDDSEEIAKECKYTCNICSQGFQRSGNYAAHMIKKHEKIICPHCPGSFDSETNLKRHMKEHRELYPCKQCDRKFQRKEYVAQHVKCVHNGERPFICEACGDALRSKGQLKEHMLTHTDYSPFECKECGKCFKQKQRLKRHMQIHGDKLICNECGKQLSCRATYNSHMLVHSDKMQHKCDYCGRAFKRAKTLKNHLILHSGLKPYSCEFCDRTFTNGSNRRTHMKRTHPNELAELEASGEKMYTKNIPELAVLKSVIRRDENLIPVVSKQSGNFAFGKKPKAKPVNTADTTNQELKN
uniref:Zinc finger protein weckle n=1 Tax=Zeugodacus cucurbitae TaxID=28588 RepID=A0A0A1XQL7_ZEUCU